jgi:crotonobetaine/carnitine-CoA ligase
VTLLDTAVRGEQGQQTTVNETLHRALLNHGGAPLLDVGGDVLTVADIVEQSSRFASGLAELGVGPGVTVACLLDNSLEAVIAWMAISRIGAIWVPLNTALKGPTLLHQLTDSLAIVVVAEPDYADRIFSLVPQLPLVRALIHKGKRSPQADHVGIGVLSFDQLRASAEACPEAPTRPDSIATLVYTSGTTGLPKACIVSHNYLVNQATQQVENCARTPEEVIWSPLPLFHINAMTAGVLGSLQIGGLAAFAPRFSVSGFWPEVERTGAKVVSLLGSMMTMIAKAPDTDVSQRCHGQVRLVRGAPFSAELRETWERRFGVQRAGSCAYGTTEASVMASTPYEEPGTPGTAGRENRYFELRIMDDDGHVAPPGLIGEIVCRPRFPNIMFQGYWRQPEATLDVMRHLWLHTGDYGRIDDDGWLSFVDRKKDYIRRRGENISSVEVESILMSHPDVSLAAVVGVPDEFSEGEEEVMAFVVGTRSTGVPEAELTQWAAERLPYFAVPRYLENRRSLPINDLGKVQKFILREEGRTDASWDREAAGVTFERR